MPEDEFPLPESTFELLNKILLAYIKTGADKKPVYYRDAAKFAEITPTVVSANSKFLLHMGFMKSEKRGYAQLTQPGKHYANMLDWRQLEESRKVLMEILSSSPMVDGILGALSMEHSMPKENFVSRIASIAEVSRTQRTNRGINTLIEMLVYSGLVNEADGDIEHIQREKMLQLLEDVPRVELPEMAQKEAQPVDQQTVAGMSLEREWVPRATINISVEVNNDTDLEKLEEALRIIRDSFQKEEDAS